jgi:RNA polymerase sigma-70 factor, ECF subfamily
MSSQRCEVARHALAVGARHAVECAECTFFATFAAVEVQCACGRSTSCEDELRRATATHEPFLGRYALAENGYRDSLPRRARDLVTGREVVIGSAADGHGDDDARWTRCGLVIVARGSVPEDSERMSEDGGLELETLRSHVAGGELEQAVTLMQKAYARDVERFVRFRRSSRARSAVEDICQEVWTSVLRGLPSFRFEAPPRVWLFSIAARRVIDVARQGPVDDAIDTDRMAAIANSLTGPLSRLLRDERAAAVRAVLEQCDPRDAELLHLRFAFDLMPQEISYLRAQETGEPPELANTIAQRIARLLLKLGRQLAKHDLFESKARK